MRRRLVVGTVAVIMAVLTVLVPPVVVLLQRATERELEVRLSSQSAAVSAAIADELIQGNTPTVDQLAKMVTPGDQLVITASDGSEVLRYGTATGRTISGSAPGPVGTSVRISTSRHSLDNRVRGPLIALGAFAIGSIALGALLASVMSRRLARPLERLADSADRLGAGDFSVSVPPPSGIAEIDGIGAALDSSAHRIDQMLIAERSFTGDATHQLRTGLTGIALQLDLIAAQGDADVQATTATTRQQVDRLTTTLDELLDLARSGAGQRVSFDLSALVAHHVADWRPRADAQGRSIVLQQRATEVRATPGFVGQIIDILIDNALTHGHGMVIVDVGDGSVAVRDEGSIEPTRLNTLFMSTTPPTASHGRGLALARRLARADGGRLEAAATAPTTFVLGYGATAS